MVVWVRTGFVLALREMLGIMSVGVRVLDAVLVDVLVFVQSNLQLEVEAIRNPAKRRNARRVRTAFEPRDHRLGHPEPSRKLALRFAAVGTQCRELLGKPTGNQSQGRGFSFHAAEHSKIATSSSIAKSLCNTGLFLLIWRLTERAGRVLLMQDPR